MNLQRVFEDSLNLLNTLSDEEVLNLTEVMNLIEYNIESWKKQINYDEKRQKNFLINKNSFSKKLLS